MDRQQQSTHLKAVCTELGLDPATAAALVERLLGADSFDADRAALIADRAALIAERDRLSRQLTEIHQLLLTYVPGDKSPVHALRNILNELVLLRAGLPDETP